MWLLESLKLHMWVHIIRDSTAPVNSFLGILIQLPRHWQCSFFSCLLQRPPWLMPHWYTPYTSSQSLFTLEGRNSRLTFPLWIPELELGICDGNYDAQPRLPFKKERLNPQLSWRVYSISPLWGRLTCGHTSFHGQPVSKDWLTRGYKGPAL